MTDNRSKEKSRKIESELAEEKGLNTEETELVESSKKNDAANAEEALNDTYNEGASNELELSNDDEQMLDQELISSEHMTETELLDEVEDLNKLDDKNSLTLGDEDLSTDELLDEEALGNKNEELVDSEALALQAQEKNQDEEDTRETRRNKRPKRERLRLIPIWLRLVISILLVGGSLILGVIVGYSVIGGGEAGEATRPETWYHIVDMIRGR
ncbi:DNA-directed RNA polymerase subunit beta [Halalkalibacter flavus]|uniref:DNA-directed RNA polymerase subunit beta n=1 Tax=Halalkalibacter flavus TaxID=3090668 RepID=UPI002FCA6481